LNKFEMLEETFDRLKIDDPDKIFGKLPTVKVLFRVDKKAVHAED